MSGYRKTVEEGLQCVSGLVDVTKLAAHLDERIGYTAVCEALEALRLACKESGLMNHHQYNQLGIQVNAAISRASGELATCAAPGTRRDKSGPWRVGGRVPLNVYLGDRPMFQCHTPEDAAMVVDKLNRAERLGGTASEYQEGCQCDIYTKSKADAGALLEAMEPFVRYMEARRDLFGENSQLCFHELACSPIKGPIVRLVRKDWERASAAFHAASQVRAESNHDSDDCAHFHTIPLTNAGIPGNIAPLTFGGAHSPDCSKGEDMPDSELTDLARQRVEDEEGPDLRGLVLPVPEEKQMMDFTRATNVTPEVDAAVDDAFEYHAWTPEMVEKGKAVRLALATAVKILIENVPPGPDRTVAIRKIREARMDANSAITHGGKY